MIHVGKVVRLAAIGMALSLVASVGLVAAWLHGVRIPFASGSTQVTFQKFDVARNLGAANDTTFILLVGTDLRPGVSGARGDAVHVLGINPTLGAGSILNFPRDTCIDIPGVGNRRINEANSNGGLELTAQTIDDLVGTQIEYGMSVDFDGFLALVNALGGIEVDVPVEMSDSYSGAFLQPGPQRLTDHQALGFSRNRHDFPQGDITRSGNQGLLILSAIAQLQREASTIPQQLRLAALVARHAQVSGMGIQDIFRLGQVAYAIDPAQFENVTIPIAGTSACAGNLAPGAGSAELFADFADDGVLQNH